MVPLKPRMSFLIENFIWSISEVYLLCLSSLITTYRTNLKLALSTNSAFRSGL